jgi:hypothetical protein
MNASGNSRVSNKNTCEYMNFCPISNEHLYEHINIPLNLDMHVDFVNGMNTTWTAGINNKFKGMSLYEVRKMMGTIVDHDWVISAPLKYSDSDMSLPDSFDSMQ